MENANTLQPATLAGVSSLLRPVLPFQMPTKRANMQERTEDNGDKPEPSGAVSRHVVSINLNVQVKVLAYSYPDMCCEG